MIRKSIILILLIIQVFSFAEDAVTTKLSLDVMGAYYLGSQGGYNAEGGFAPPTYEVLDLSPSVPLLDPGRPVGSSWGGAEAKVALNYVMKFPFLVGDGALMSGNNLAVKFSGELSPVSINALAATTLTPIAFLNFTLGLKGGTGWAIGFNGLGKNLPGVNNESAQEEPFSGLVYEIFASGVFQFDLAALVPGDWNHVVVLAEGKVIYKAFTNAGPNEAWVWEADSGMNFNGFWFKGSYFLGYQMPIVLNTAGFLVETSQYIDTDNVERSKSSLADWNSAFMAMRFGPLFNFALTENMSLAVLPQFKYDRKFTNATAGNRYFEYREFEAGFVYFDRIAFSYSLSL
ncbi:MAG: hypothetical protein JXR70_03570 [Spirochaetales bacterium]|nr:hypothetical protein [Spirochaetales bacterium]